MKRYVAGQLGREWFERRLVIKFGCMLIAATFLFWADNHLLKVLIEEPFYLMVGLISVFAMGLVVFFTTRDDRLMH